jgi:hypothetical protein
MYWRNWAHALPVCACGRNPLAMPALKMAGAAIADFAARACSEQTLALPPAEQESQVTARLARGFGGRETAKSDNGCQTGKSNRGIFAVSYLYRHYFSTNNLKLEYPFTVEVTTRTLIFRHISLRYKKTYKRNLVHKKA